MWMSVLGFAALSFIILVAGWALSWSGDVLAEKTGLGRTWVGLIFLATATSLPELFSGLGALAIVDAPDILVGSLMGSCVFNLALLALIDLFHRPSSIYTLAGQSHILSAGLGIGMIAFAGFTLLFAELWQEPQWGRVGISAPVILLAYFLACRLTFYFERQNTRQAEESHRYADVSMSRAIGVYLVAAAFVVGAALRLPVTADRIASAMEWNQSFVGTLFVALSTSFPELVVTTMAVRMGALDMGISNVLGSNLFNIAILGVLDPLYRDGSILSGAQPIHAATAFSALIMSTLVIVGLIYRPAGRVLHTMSWISILLVATFVVNAFLLFNAGGGF